VRLRRGRKLDRALARSVEASFEDPVAAADVAARLAGSIRAPDLRVADFSGEPTFAARTYRRHIGRAQLPRRGPRR
jgi:hypothetical protein